MTKEGRLQVLCLHGKRQDGEIFSQRLDKLTRKLAPVAEFTFVDAPFELALEEVSEGLGAFSGCRSPEC